MLKFPDYTDQMDIMKFGTTIHFYEHWSKIILNVSISITKYFGIILVKNKELHVQCICN